MRTIRNPSRCSEPIRPKPNRVFVFVAQPAYLFAMKCLAMRAAGVDDSEDIADIRKLGALLGIAKAEEALAVILRYYPEGRISPKTKFGLEEIFGR